MADCKLDFMQMLSVMRVIDDDDRVTKFQDCIEKQFEQVSRKVSEYKRDGSLTITMKFTCDKKNKNTVNVYAEVSKKIPKGSQCNAFYSDNRTGGLYFDNPDQLKLVNNVQPIGKDLAGQNN